MQDQEALKNILDRIDGKGYKAYKDIEGSFAFEDFDLMIDHVQGDPFAAPSSIRVRCPNEHSAEMLQNESRTIAFRDYLTRSFWQAIGKYTKGNRGSGKSGVIRIDKPGQEILDRTSVVVDEDHIEVRLEAGLPAFGRKAAARQAKEMFFTEIPHVIEHSLVPEALDEEKVLDHLRVCEDADSLREQLKTSGLIAFVADHSILPRKSGVDDRPLPEAIPFQSPESMRKEFVLPNRTVKGMGIPKGISLIVGGGYHGKSTLLNAVELGIYNHIPGDGREFVISDPECMKIRSEDGRSITKVDISPFIYDLPQNKSTASFSSENASGSTSQAANIMEALEVGASAMLIDEDTSATNFMIRDQRMQELVPKTNEPITPYIDKARQLYTEHEVSTILVIGGSGSYFDIADYVICMVEYEPYDLTEKAHAIAGKHQEHRANEGGQRFGEITSRTPLPKSIDPFKGKKMKVRAEGLQNIGLGVYQIDIACIEQLSDPSQVRAIARALVYAKQYMGDRTINEVIEQVMEDIHQQSLDVISNKPTGDFAGFRKLDLAAVLNRLRNLYVK